MFMCSNVHLLFEKFKVLQVNNILSAPVFRDRELLGLIDVLDIARFALDFWTQRVARNEWRGYEYSTEEFFQYPVIDVLSKNSRI